MTLAPMAFRERAELGPIVTIARKELRDAIRNRWFVLYAVAFIALAVAISAVALPGGEVGGAGSFGRTAASLVALVQLIVPLMGLTLGAQTLGGSPERGTLRFLLSHPVSRAEAFWGTYAGLSVALLAAASAGFGIAGVASAARGAAADPVTLLEIAFLSWVLALISLGLGMLISSLARRPGAAIGAALFVWLGLVFIGDLGLMGTAVATRLPVAALFLGAVANPVEAFRLTAVTLFGGSLDVLGPAGSYAVDFFGSGLTLLLIGALLVWGVVPLLVGLVFFSRRRDL